ncbi:hypothetical protein GX586_01560 [bacterium]|nr:hypothetical protein [bacterium]
MNFHHRLCAFVGLLAVSTSACLCAASFVWLEGEEATSCNVDAVRSGWGNQHYLSGGKWLNISISEKDIAAKVPTNGVVITYDFPIDQPGNYEIWNRIGFEFVRSPFSWRIDDGEWHEVTPNDLTIDLMDIANWCEVAWLKLGQQELTRATHTLTIRMQPISESGKPGKILYASDCFCITDAPFKPNSRFKPGEDWQAVTDRFAAATVYDLPATEPGTRAVLPVTGLWQIARYDEHEIIDRTGPVASLPARNGLFWKSIPVPGNKDALCPELLFCHRYLYRTQVFVPASMSGRGFALEFPSVNMIATVYVNGEFCGWTKAPFARWQCDITRAVKPGETNEIVVAMKDTYYGIAKDTRRAFNYPESVMHGQGASMQLDFPVWNHMQNGILETPLMIAAGPVYVEDVFAIPSVSKKQLGLEITLCNPGDATSVELLNEIVPLEGGEAGKTFAAKSISVPARTNVTVTLTEPWADPTLWWPDAPRQYSAITRVRQNGAVKDTCRTKFGFREWGWDGPEFKLNGIPWHGRADLVMNSAGEPDDAAGIWKRHGQTMVRFWNTTWGGLGMQETLDYHDATGTPVRRSCIFDGEMASYGLTERITGEDGTQQTVARKALFDNWIHRLKAWVRGERNHPSVFIWSLENEIVFINSRNLGTLKYVEPEITRAARDVMTLDPTRPVMVDGGRALTDQSLPVNGCHYEEAAVREYPDEAYELNTIHNLSGWQPWPMATNKPMVFGEAFFANGHPPGWYAAVMGDAAFLGRAEARYGVGLFTKILSEGYRWYGVGAFHFWLGGESEMYYNSWQPVCVLCREWNWTFAEGGTVVRKLKVFNDTHDATPVKLTWNCSIDGMDAGKGEKVCTIPPGRTEDVVITLQMPKLKAKDEPYARGKGELVLECFRGEDCVFRDVKQIAVIATTGIPNPELKQSDLLVFDPHGAAKDRLRSRGIAFTEITSYDDIPAAPKVIIIGKDALTGAQATDARWRERAAAGARIIVLDQANPLHYQALPADLDPTPHAGRIAFAENLDHPVFKGIENCDFFTWSGDHIVYRNVYKKAAKGASSLVQCDEQLSCTALALCPVGDGMLLLCQMVVGEKLVTDPVAQRLFDNMLNYAAGYAPVRKRTALVLDPASPLAKQLGASGLQYQDASDIKAALGDERNDIVVFDATTSNLDALNGDRAVVDAFTGRGGWLMACGLAPEGLDAFNTLVGVEHVIRPVEMERITPPAVRDPLLAGLTVRDFVMLSGEKIFPWAGDVWMADDVFSYAVDVDEIAPFCTFPAGGTNAFPRTADYPRNMVNGFVTADGWRYIHYTPTNAVIELALPKRETITGFSIVPNPHYNLITKLGLYYDDDPVPVELDVEPGNERQDFDLAPRAAEKLTLRIAGVRAVKGDITGIDNIWLRVARDETFSAKVKPLANIGGLVKYPMGSGGVILNQLRFKDHEAVPVNAEKKQVITATVLKNLGAQFSGGAEGAVAFTCTPVPLDAHCNLYLSSDKGWYDKERDLRHLPLDEQKFNGITFAIRNFKTSPLESAVTLKGPGPNGNKAPDAVRGIGVGRKADALFFLHTFIRTREWRGRDERSRPPVVFEYTVDYEDGTSTNVPVQYGIGVDNWLQDDPKGLKGAALAWTAPFAGGPDGPRATVYQMRWDNPKPDVAIKSVDMAYGRERYGAPVLLAITAGTAGK